MAKPIEDVLKKLLEAQLINLPEVKQEESNVEKPIWYKDNKYCQYYRQKGHEMNKCNQLKNIIQRLIDNGQVSTGNLVAQPNREMGIF